MREVATASGPGRRALVSICGTLAMMLGGSLVHAQEEEDSEVPIEVDESMIEEIVVTGVRRDIQNSIQLKRNSVEIVDGLNAEEIGSLPALSIGEALETITGAATHRENGGATEVAIRGLGPYLGTTTVNVRESTNGSGNRAVNFSIFPSELFNSVAIHKTQSASYIEGAVSGQVQLTTRRPIEYGEQLAQFSLKGSAHPDDSDIIGQDENGYRATASYINSWDLDGLGTIGITLGGQLRDDSNPEAEATHSTGGGRLEVCLLDSFDSNAQPFDLSSRCENNASGSGGDSALSNDRLQALIDSNPNYNSVADIPFAYIPRSRQFRRNTTDDDRHAVFGAIQWQPNDNLDVMLDFQQSERDQKELRQDLLFGNTQNNVRDLVSDPRTGLVQSFVVDTGIRSKSTDFSRFEEYEGAGLNIAWQATENLEVSFDAAFADTRRVETDIEATLGADEVLRTHPDDVQNREDFWIRFDVDVPGTDGLALPTVLSTDGSSSRDPASLLDFDVNDPRYFTGKDRAQVRGRQQIREHTIDALRLDFSWDTESLGFVNNLQAGIRASSLEYRTFGGNRSRAGINRFDDEDLDGVKDGSNNTPEARAVIFNAANNCGHSSFPEPDFLSESRGGRDLITFAHGIGTGTGWATFDHGCLLDELLANYGGRSALQLENGIETNSVDLTEDVTALYLQANYESSMSGRPVRGNFGVRVVRTEVDSIGYRTPLAVIQEEGLYFVEPADVEAEYESVLQTNSYTEVLPSLTFIMDINADWVFRAGVFRGISRPDPHSYSNSRSINTNDSDDADSGYGSLEEAVYGISSSGNPKLQSLPSWNVDIGVEWYANEDTLLAAGVYWKRFQGGFENAYQPEDFLIDGNVVTGSVRTTQVSDKESSLRGVEITATHSFDYLPGILGGFGGKISYNYADSDFEFEDGHGGDGISFDADGNATPLLGLLPPAGLWGLSRHTSATQIYWQNDRFNVQAIFKARSGYFQGYSRDTGARIRYVDDYNTLDLRLRYDITDSIQLSLEGINVLSEPRIDFRGLEGQVGQTLEYGPRLFLGVRAKFN